MSTVSPSNSNLADQDQGALPASPWSLRTRLIVSALLLFQLSAVLYGPLSMPMTITAEYARWLYRPYTGATYQGHSYKFFSPEPGPSHLVRYELEMPDGAKKVGTFPNLDDEWPRLFYHRHFMLSEHLNQAVPPPGPDDPAPTDFTTMTTPPSQLRVAQSYANHLMTKYGANSATLYLIRHFIPTPEQAQKGMKLTDPSLYRERRLGTFALNQ